MKRKRIVHLDDHRIVCEGVRKLVKTQFPDCYYLCYTNATKAFRYIVNCVQTGNSPDVLITDFQHPGLNGYEFSTSIRQLEKLLGREPMQILLLTMFPRKYSIITKGLKEKTFDNYISLNSDANQMIDLVKGFLSDW